MGLKDLNFAQAKIVTPGGEFTVRGLSLTDIMSLANRHYDVLASLFDQVAGRDPSSISLDDAGSMGATLLKSAPDVAAEVIAMAAGECDEESIRIAKSLPFPAQVEALEKIGQQTFATEDDLKKAVAAVIRIMQGATGVLHNLRA